jgi:hypothetical protein
MPEAQLARIMSKGPLTAVASANKPTSRPTVVASRNAAAEDEDAGVVARPASRTRVTASVAPDITATIPMPKSRPTAQEPAQGGFNLASASSRPAAAPAQREPEPSSGFNLASASSYAVEPAPRPSQAASVVPSISANDVINERGFWQGLTNTAERPIPPADIPEQRTAAAEPPITGNVAHGSVAPWPMPHRAAGRDALAYAPAHDPVDTRTASKARVVARLPAPRNDAKAAAAATKQSPRPRVKIGERFNDPWLRAMIVSPSALGYMSTSLYGALDTVSLKGFMVKPATTVMMTFSNDPHLGMSSEQFKGNAVVFVSTVTFRQRTAALR